MGLGIAALLVLQPLGARLLLVRVIHALGPNTELGGQQTVGVGLTPRGGLSLK
jgi:hypothetical protein